jgi:arsenate reductase
MNRKKVLFVCIHNSARSQMAEAWLNDLCGDTFIAESAGLEPGQLNPLVVTAMREVRIDISGKKTQSVADVLKRGRQFDYVITVCDETSAERCPIFPGTAQRLHWGFPDPSQFTGSPAEKLEQTRQVRDTIKAQVRQWCAGTTATVCRC